MASFATALSNVRRLSASNLAHQAKPAQLLVAIEQTISSQLSSSSSSPPSLPHSATAYFASLLQCLEKACADELPGQNDEAMAETENMGQGALIPALLYLLAIVVPETSTQVVLSKVSPLLECCLPLYDSALEHPPALRSLIQITTSVVTAAPAGLLSSSPLLKKAWNYLLELNLDPRPKVRHVAQEGVRKVLTTPIPPKMTAGSHPYLPRAREWTMRILQDEASGAGAGVSKKKARFAGEEEQEGKKAIWVVQGLRGWVAVWGDEQLSTLCSLLLSLPPIPHLTSQIYDLLALLLTPPPADAASAAPSVLANLPTILDSLLASPPDLKSSVADVPAYLSAVTSALIKLSRQDVLSAPTYLNKAFSYIFTSVLLSPVASPVALNAASDAIGQSGIVRYCVSDEMILAAVNYHRSGSAQPGARKKMKTPFVTKLLEALVGAMEANALKLQYLLPILAAVVSRLRLRVTPTAGSGQMAEVDPQGQGNTAAEELLLELIRDVGDLRVAKGFEHKEKVDEVVGAAIEVIGVEGVLKALPLNIEPDATGMTPQPGRAHLLPLIRARTTNDSLAYFTTYFRPLSERVFGRKVAAEEAGRATEAKIWEALVSQVWDCFPGFCEMPRDLSAGLTTPFLTLLTNLLYTQPLLLSSLLKALSNLVTSTQTIIASATASEELLKQFGIDQAGASRNLDYLKTLAKDMVSVLLNVFSKLPREQRGMVGDVIGLWAGIMTQEDLVATYNTVTTHLSSNLTTTAPAVPGGSPISHTMLDLLIIFVPLLPSTQARALFNATAGPTMLDHGDATVQKKSYRLLKRLIERQVAGGVEAQVVPAEHVGELVRLVNASAASVGPGAQRDRLQCIATIVDIIPTDSLQLIPELLSEAVLGTKEVNEKARDAGFDLLVVMANKMAQGGTVVQGGQSSTQATVEEYIMMVAAGLTGTTPHMISASINALSRLLFEYKDDVLPTTISELVSTTTLFLTSKNREIVKSALGFIKVATVALPASIVEPHLPQLVPALLGWVHDHKNHFKSKTVHIFERMMRKHGYDAILTNAPQGGERKVLEGIKKKKERAKRKKAEGGADDEDDEERGERKASSGNAFDDILYNSDSDSGSDDEDEQGGNGAQRRGGKAQQAQQAQGKNGANKRDKRAGQQQFIRNEGDEPMDLLSRSIAGGVTNTNPETASRKRKPGQDAAHFQKDASGKLVIAESDDEHDHAGRAGGGGGGAGAGGGDAMAGAAFMSSQMGAHGQSRDARGNLRFNRNTREAREQERGMDIDVDAALEDMGHGDKKRAGDKLVDRRKKRQAMGKLGDEFKAKRAGGDIKRNDGPDPYSYVPIGQATKGKKGSHAPRINLTNKKKGSSGRR